MIVEHLCLDPAGTAARILVLAAHPGDETVGASWLLAHLPDVLVLHVTDGVPAPPAGAPGATCTAALAYAGLRRGELLEAMAHVGLEPARCARLGFTEGDAWRDLETLVWSVVDAFMTWAPDVILTHAYEGGHPDHDAAAFAAQTAARLLGRMHLPTPAIAEFASYRRGEDGLEAGTFLPASSPPSYEVALDAEDCRRKRAMYRALASQRRLLETFTIGTEQYRAAPRYDFARPPHAGALFYETQPLGVTGAAWRAQAGAAAARLRATVPAVA